MLIQLVHTPTQARLLKILDTAGVVARYYKYKKYNSPKPIKPFPSLEEALRSNRLCNDYIKRANLSIKEGLRLINSSLTETEVVWTWQQLQNAAKFNTKIAQPLN